jgi:N-carbamoylputrescine amidase
MKVTVCELHDDRTAFAAEWQQLVAHMRAEGSEFVLLPEMPFCQWFADSRSFDATVWEAAVNAHDEWEHRLRELAPAVVAASRPVDFGNERYNEGFVWDAEHGSRAVHAKAFLPDEAGVWEASWYNRATPEFSPFQLDPVDSVSLGFLICTEMWAMDEARLYGQEGVQLLLTPRGTAAKTLDKWLAGGRVAAIVAGAYGLSSNRFDESGSFGGQSWIIDPDGEVLGLTSREHPFVTLDLDLTLADLAKTSFPRYAMARPPAVFWRE